MARLENSELIDALRSDWIHPIDVLVVLMIIGPDIVQTALAQIAGQGLSPVSFSFGWVAYSFYSLLCAVGGNKLVPDPDFDCILINTRTGYIRNNRSWILGRMMRDYDSWKPEALDQHFSKLSDEAYEKDVKEQRESNEKYGNGTPFNISTVERRDRIGLCVTIYQTSPHKHAGTASRDRLFYSGIVTTIFQLGIAAIPWAVRNDWTIMMVAVGGSLLAYTTGALPQWGVEKWKCRHLAKDIALSEGNGAQHVVIIRGDAHALDLEALAAGSAFSKHTTKFAMGALSVLWLAFLVTVTALEEEPWYLLAIGGLGMLQNIFVAGAKRRPSAFGVHLEFQEFIWDRKVMRTLMQVEEKYPAMGASLLGTFFPGDLRADEKRFWEEKKAARGAH